jgi:hypothetical protein
MRACHVFEDALEVVEVKGELAQLVRRSHWRRWLLRRLCHGLQLGRQVGIVIWCIIRDPLLERRQVSGRQHEMICFWDQKAFDFYSNNHEFIFTGKAQRADGMFRAGAALFDCRFLDTPSGPPRTHWAGSACIQTASWASLHLSDSRLK